MNIVVVKCYARVGHSCLEPSKDHRRLIFRCLRPDRPFLEVSVRAHALSIITKFALLFKIGLIVLAERNFKYVQHSRGMTLKAIDMRQKIYMHHDSWISTYLR